MGLGSTLPRLLVLAAVGALRRRVFDVVGANPPLLRAPPGDEAADMPCRPRGVLAAPSVGARRADVAAGRVRRRCVGACTGATLLTVGLDDQYDIRLSVGDAEAILNAAREGNLSPANEQRKRLREGRSRILNEMNKHVPEGLRGMYLELLAESRNSEAEVNQLVRSAAEDLHAERMAEMAAASNEIACNSAEQAKALKFATWALVMVTAVLIAATIVGALIARAGV